MAPAFGELVRLALVNEARESCELELIERPGRTIAVRLMATLLARAEPLILLTVQERAVAQPHVSGVVPALSSGREPGAAGQQG